MGRCWLFALLSFSVSCSTAFANTFLVTVKVVDADQKPVTKADVALFWNVNKGTMNLAGQPIVTDANGEAVLRVDDWNEKRPILVLSADRKLGGVIGVSRADDGKRLTIALSPTVRVKGKLECKELNFKPKWAWTMVAPDGFRPYFAQDGNESAVFEFVLPTGKYTLRSFGTDVEDAEQRVILTADRRELDFDTINLKASAIAKLRGKPAPEWVVADARGVKAGVKLADQKGKWVFIEFWGFW